ncbi:MAG: HisA/HisF-related TIM barrel protein [Gammaproteobacteria bacterium]|nr:HisA/HisF-related TIM barrel protein [Gammaproteobacteria bacterium]
MLTKRVIVTLTLNGGSLYRTKNFNPDRLYTMNFVDMELADELVILDVTRRKTARRDFYDRVLAFGDQCFLPCAVGGWVRTLEDAQHLMRNLGADKVVINSEAFRRPEFISELAEKFGSQSVVVSIDVKNGIVHIDQGRTCTDHTAIEWAQEAEEHGAGEIYLMDMTRDGSLRGYNLELLQDIVASVKIPVIISGGCGGWRHMAEGFDAGADACSTSVIHHFTKTSLNAAKTYLHENGHVVRL